MENNLIKHSIRALNRNKGYLAINIIGLAIGIACSLIIALFIFRELSFDQFNEKGDRIFRLVVSGNVNNRELKFACTAAIVGPTMKREFPEVENYTRVNTLNEPTIRYGEELYTEHNFYEADSTFFAVFSYPLIRGNKKSVLNAPHTLVLSQSMAKKIFGKNDPMNKLILVGDDKVPYRITGIMEDMPENSHIRADMIGSFITNPNSNDTWWVNNNYATYILLKTNTRPESVNIKIQALLRKYMGDFAQKTMGMTVDEFIAKSKYAIHLQPIKDIHLDPSITQMSNTVPADNPKYLYIFGCVALLIIAIAAINFMNLSTAQSSKRAKEVGIKKVSGSSKKMLIVQFLTESLLLTFLSLILAIVILENILPYFNNLLGMKLEMKLFANWYAIQALLGLTLFVGILAGSYPAFFLSSFEPAVVLKGKLNESLRNGRLRSILVILQFSISIMLIVGTIIMFRQIRFMLHKDLGFKKEQLMVIPRADAIGTHVKTFKEALQNIPEVLKVAASTDIPGHIESGKTYIEEGHPDNVLFFVTNHIDKEFLDVYGIKLASGRTFSNEFATDNNACLVNESTVKQMNLSNPLTTNLVDGFEKITVVGIVKNFNFEPLRNQINPYIFRLNDDSASYRYISIRLSKMANSKTITQIEGVWNEFAASQPFQYFFMDQDYAQKYKEERQNAQLSMLFSVLAIIIAALGLFGLTSFTIEQRTKEIGIRKVLGSSVTGIFYLVSKEFLLLICISAIISCPVIYYAASNWLKNYYYRISLRPTDFLMGFIIAVIIALATISYHTIRSAKTNLVEALRYE